MAMIPKWLTNYLIYLQCQKQQINDCYTGTEVSKLFVGNQWQRELQVKQQMGHHSQKIYTG